MYDTDKWIHKSEIKQIRKVSSEIDPHQDGQLIFDKEAKQCPTSKLIIPFIYIDDACISTNKIKFLSLDFISFTKAAKMCADLNIKWKIGCAL